MALASENILEIERSVDAFDDSSGRIVSGNAGAEPAGVSVALGDENGAGARQM
jgi:hypothetical protein